MKTFILGLLLSLPAWSQIGVSFEFPEITSGFGVEKIESDEAYQSLLQALETELHVKCELPYYRDLYLFYHDKWTIKCGQGQIQKKFNLIVARQLNEDGSLDIKKLV